jgi:hypothetical protein
MWMHGIEQWFQNYLSYISVCTKELMDMEVPIKLCHEEVKEVTHHITHILSQHISGDHPYTLPSQSMFTE